MSNKAVMIISDGRSPLILALDKGALDIAELLIEKTADVNARNKNVDTPIILQTKTVITI